MLFFRFLYLLGINGGVVVIVVVVGVVGGGMIFLVYCFFGLYICWYILLLLGYVIV